MFDQKKLDRINFLAKTRISRQRSIKKRILRKL